MTNLRPKNLKQSNQFISVPNCI